MKGLMRTVEEEEELIRQIETDMDAEARAWMVGLPICTGLLLVGLLVWGAVILRGLP